MMNETIATLANTTIQEVLNDERIKRLVLDIIQAKHQDTTSRVEYLGSCGFG